MAVLGNPFGAVVPRKLTNGELIQAIREDIVGELEAIHGYEAHVMATDDPLAKAVLSDISNEEKAHIGELMTLLRHLDPQEAEHFASGQAEVREMMIDLGINPDAQPAAEGSTVGSLLK
ncbi:ubiquinone biosynthesis protein COQ7 [Christensenellaceae bacterium OttesenSCG-928-K19]|nr:ubiquinone biosynthesis protein COQ7 [Christensenellaceae bacterium OttesenSCG-928-K19]